MARARSPYRPAQGLARNRDHGPQNVGELGQWLGLSYPATSLLINKLEQRGLVTHVAWTRTTGAIARCLSRPPAVSLTEAASESVELTDEERQPCEIWTRVMGYHRPVSAFNAGKKGEYAERVCFAEPRECD